MLGAYKNLQPADQLPFFTTFLADYLSQPHFGVDYRRLLAGMAEHSFLKSTFPVLLRPYTEAKLPIVETSSADEHIPDGDGRVQDVPVSAFMNALLGKQSAVKDLTENGDMTFQDSGEPLVNLFSELEGSVSNDRLKAILDAAWKADPNATVKMIWNARSIHLGKSDRYIFYRATGWLAQYHPATLLANLQWLVRPIIQKKVPKPKDATQEAVMVDKLELDEDSDFELVEADSAIEKPVKIEEAPHLCEFDVKYGVSHGYWKDLLNILYLAAHGDLRVDADPRKHFNNTGKGRPSKRSRNWTQGIRKQRIQKHYEAVCEKLEHDSFYKALHMTVARLFADQLIIDKRRLESGNVSEVKKISLAAKWAPTNKCSHDENTFVASTIAELLYPQQSLCPGAKDREAYLRQARLAYQLNLLTPLRKHIDIVERHLTAGTFELIKYERLPSKAMKMYTKLFSTKDTEHFNQYLAKVGKGEAKISGATLLPSTMVAEARAFRSFTGDAVELAEKKVRNGQWNTLVQRIKDSGTMESAIAVCDVSGSMGSPRFADKSTPMDAAIGLSLVLAEVCKPPFGGTFITFSEEPSIIRLDDQVISLEERVALVERSSWGMSTNFVAVFSDLILPLAKTHNLKQEDMVKRVFVFSDMQFNQADSSRNRWSTSFERIKKLYEEAGYEMPELVFWNLASNAHSRSGIQSKPVEADQPGTALVSGYSQAMMKTFMEGGSFDKLSNPDSIEESIVVDKDGNETKVTKKLTPLELALRAIGHDAYRMLRVVD